LQVMSAKQPTHNRQLPLFVYGTLKSSARNSTTDALMQRAVLLGAATYQGRLYRVDCYPGLVASADDGDNVEGELYQLASAAQLAALDDYEECGATEARPTEFVRQVQAVTVAAGQTRERKIEAWVYLYTRSVKSLLRIASFPE
jgi:gamma-glutamylcyclotransferase (GGCT)/AIG2-like uncharacterized protein YtfP